MNFFSFNFLLREFLKMKVKHHAQGADFNSRQGQKIKHVVTLEKNMF